MYFHVLKPKTKKGLSYVLKSSVLKNALEQRNIDSYILVNYWTPQWNNVTKCSLIEVEFWLASHGVNYDRFYIRIGVVPAEERKTAELLVIEKVLPELMDWMAKQLAEPANSTNRGGAYRAYYIDQNLVVERSGKTNHFH